MSEVSNFMAGARTALLVVDVQQVLFERPNPVFLARELNQRINKLADRMREDGGSVVFIQHENTRLLLPDTQDWEIHMDLRVDPADRIIRKKHGNAFKHTPLNKVLQDLAIETVVVTGLVSHGCVRATCIGALEMAYRVILAADCHSSWTKNAAERIEEVNQEMKESGVQVLQSAKIDAAK